MSNKKNRAIVAVVAVLIIGAIVLAAVPKASAAPTVFRVDANGNITANGVAIRVKGASWFGLQGRHEPSNDATNPSGAPMEQYIGNVFWASTSRTYDQDVSEFKSMGLNVIRVPFSPQTLNASDPQGMAPYLKNTASVVIANSRLAFETVLKKLDAAGIYTMPDLHSCSNYVDWRKGRFDARPPWVDATRDNYDFTRENCSCAASNNPSTVTRIQAYDSTKWLADMRTVAGFTAGLPLNNMIGIDIYNEPWDYSWAEWRGFIDQAYSAINAVNTNILIFAQGISGTNGNQDGSPTTINQTPHGSAGNPNWGENLYEAGTNPPTMPKERLVWTPHTYGPSVFVQASFADPAQTACATLEGDAFGDAKCQIVINPARLNPSWQEHFGYLKAMGYAVVVGEWGGNMQWPGGKASLRDQARFSYLTNKSSDQQWQNAFVDYLISVKIYDTVYWSVNPESGDTGGLYTHAYDPVSNTGGWGTWGSLDSTKMTLVHRLWDVAPVTGPTSTPVNTVVGPTNTAVSTAVRTNTPGGPTATRTRTPTRTRTATRTATGATAVRTNTTAPTAVRTNTTAPTAARTNTPVPGATNTPVRTNTPVPQATATSGGTGTACSPVNATITAPFTQDGAGTLCWKSNNLGTYINSWNLNSLTINGVNKTNLYVASSGYPAKLADGYWYVAYNSSVAWGHFEAK